MPGLKKMKDIGKDYKLNLFINNKLVPLKPFLRNFVKQIILSMIFNLKDIEGPKKIELVVEREAKKEEQNV